MANRIYVDEDYGFKVAAPAHWTRENPAAYRVSGELCRAWSPDGLASICIFVEKISNPITPRALVNARAVDALVEWNAEVQVQEVRAIAGMQAMCLRYTAQGTGRTVDGKGNVRTCRHWFAIPREGDILHLSLMAPESHLAEFQKVFDTMLQSLEVTGSQTEEQQASH